MQQEIIATCDYSQRYQQAIMSPAMAQDSPSRRLDQFIVRFPDGMRDKLKEQAAINSRSMNSEIIARLERSFGFPDPGVLDSYKAMALQQRVIIELADAAGIKISKQLREDILQVISEAAGDIQ